MSKKEKKAVLSKFIRFVFILGFVINAIEKYKGKFKAGTLKNGKKNIHIPYGPYEKYMKRPLDFSLSLLAIFFLWPLMIGIGILVKIKLGSPVIFRQERPGLNEKIFILHKYRTMNEKHYSNGNLKPDSERLTNFGKKLRSSSLDELPELFDILIGNLSIVGPRPQLVRDMVFMSDEHRRRHEIIPGLTGLAQVSGRNRISWEEKLDRDIEYSDKITFLGDLKIVLETIGKVFVKDGICEEGQETALDYGDYLLQNKRIDSKRYIELQTKAKELLEAESIREYN